MTILFDVKCFRLLSTPGAKAFATQHGPSGRRLERNSVGLTTLIAGDLVTLALTAACATASATAAAEIGATRIATLLASFRLAQIPFLIILLLAVCKGESVSAFRAGDIDVRHDLFLHEKARRGQPGSLFQRKRLSLPRFLRLSLSTMNLHELRAQPLPVKVSTPDTFAPRLETLSSGWKFTARLRQCTE